MKKFINRNFLTRKSFFFRFLRSYLIVLLIPFTAILVMYNNAQKTIQEEILSSNENHMNQFVNIIDLKLGSMTEKTFQILNSGVIRKEVLYRSSITDTSHAYGIYETKNYLDDIPLDDFSDIFVYFQKSDRIISADKSSLSSHSYYETYYQGFHNGSKKNDGQYNAFLAALTPNTLIPHIVSLGQVQDTPYLGVVLSMNYSNSLKKGEVTAVLVLKPELLKDLIQNSMYQKKGSIMIYDDTNKLLNSAKGDAPNLDLTKYSGNKDNIYYDKIDGEDYIIQFFPSKVLNCTYVSVIESSVFWEKLNGMRTISIVSIILSMLVSIFLSWMLASNSYSPINSIVHTIRNKSDFSFDLNKKSELDFIKDVIVKTFHENDMLSTRIKRSKNNIFEEFMLHAMQGTLANNKYLEREFDQIRQNFISDSFCILLINIDTVNETITGPLNSNEGKRILSLIVGNIMSELCGNYHQGFVISLKHKVYAVVLNYSASLSQSKKQEEALGIGHTFQNFIKQHFEILSTISVSYPVDGVYNINSAYQQALSAMDYRYILGRGSIIPFQDVSNKRFSYNNSFNSKNSLILIHYVKENAEEDIAPIINQIIENSKIGVNSSLSVIECFKYDLVNTVNKIIYEIGAMELEKQNNFIHSLISAETFDEFKESLNFTLVSLKNYRNENKEQITVCDKAEVLIHECYMDINLNNTSIADKLDISPSYLAKLFKAQKNISLLDYLYQVRLDNAKSFLRDSNLTIEEIASKTGFLSNSALIKTFKKYEGITPGSYRKLIT